MEIFTSTKIRDAHFYSNVVNTSISKAENMKMRIARQDFDFTLMKSKKSKASLIKTKTTLLAILS